LEKENKMKKALLTGLAGILLTGCVTAKKAEQPLQEVKTPQEIAIDYAESMEELKKTKEQESKEYNEDFSGSLDQYNDKTSKKYKELLQKIKEKEEKFKKYREGLGTENK
jgi:hypothetical protein